VVTSWRTTGLGVHADVADQTISIRPHSVWVGPGLLSVEQVIERIEGLRSLIPDRMTGDG
jgi:hypothetical protein